MAVAPRTTLAPPSPDPRGTVLLAEDDVALRALVAGALRRRGYHVVEASDGAELVRQVADRLFAAGGRAPVDAVVTDVHMPRYSGLEALTWVRAFAPTIPVVVVTAFSDDALDAQVRRRGARAVVRKPFELEHLARVLDACVAPRAARPASRPRE